MSLVRHIDQGLSWLEQLSLFRYYPTLRVSLFETPEFGPYSLEFFLQCLESTNYIIGEIHHIDLSL